MNKPNQKKLNSLDPYILPILPPLPKKEILHTSVQKVVRGYTSQQMMDYAEATVSATLKKHAENNKD